MKMVQIVNAIPALQKLAGENLTPKTLYHVSKLLSKLDEEIQFYQTEYYKIVSALGTEISPDKWDIPPENREELTRRVEELNDIDVDIELTVVKLPTSEHFTLSYKDLCLLKDLVELDFIE